MTSDYVETGRGVAHAWLCDVMGHMSSRHIAALFDDAGYHMMAALGQAAKDERTGWADVRIVDEFKREIEAGALILIRSRVARTGRTSLVIEHLASGVLDGDVRATREATIVCFDLNTRKAQPLPDTLVRQLDESPAV